MDNVTRDLLLELSNIVDNLAYELKDPDDNTGWIRRSIRDFQDKLPGDIDGQ